MNIEVHVSFSISVFSLDTYPRVELLDHMVFPLVFQGTSILFPILAIPIYIPTNR